MAKRSNKQDSATATLDIEAIDALLTRVPPQSLEAEEAVIGGLLVDSTPLNDLVELIKPHDFYHPQHQCLFEAMVHLFNKSEPIDVITVTEILKTWERLDEAGGRATMMGLAQEHLTTGNLLYYARLIRDKSLLRALITAGSGVVEAAFETEEASDALDKAQQLIFNVAQRGLPENVVPIRDILPITFDQIEERHANKGSLMGISSGFYELDLMTSGLQQSDLLIVAARPSMGKTAFCLNIAGHVALREKKPVLFMSLEMSKEQLVTRLLCSEAELDAQKIRSGHLTEKDFMKISQAMGKLGDAPLYIDDTPGMTVMEMRAKARKLKLDAGDLGLIVIDYLQLMEGSGGNSGGFDNRVQVISQISRGLKGLAREVGVPVIALSQLSRAVESRQDKRPMLSDLRESGSIEQDADLVMFIYRDEYYNAESERPGTADIIIAKQRNGPVGTVELLFRNNITRFLNPAQKKVEIF
ncbi:MAG: replicative DNA helicase [Vampirovibrionales bacterium]|nr:replicative DNA helicase [Vampirovibrionales bacterium]